VLKEVRIATYRSQGTRICTLTYRLWLCFRVWMSACGLVLWWSLCRLGNKPLGLRLSEFDYQPQRLDSVRPPGVQSEPWKTSARTQGLFPACAGSGVHRRGQSASILRVGGKAELR